MDQAQRERRNGVIGIGAICPLCDQVIRTGEAHLSDWGPEKNQTVHEACSRRFIALSFRHYRREMKNALTERAEWGDRRGKMKAAREVLKGKKTSGRVSLTETEAAAIREALDDYQALDGAYVLAGINAEGLLRIIDDASKLYRAGSRGEAAQILGWTTGKRGVMEHHHSIVATYLLQVGMGLDKNQVVENIMAIFGLQSREAIIKLLTREKKRLGSLPLPSNWQKV